MDVVIFKSCYILEIMTKPKQLHSYIQYHQELIDEYNQMIEDMQNMKDKINILENDNQQLHNEVKQLKQDLET